MEWLRSRKPSQASQSLEASTELVETELNEDIWPAIAPPQARPSTSDSQSPTRDFTLSLTSVGSLPAAPRHARSTFSSRGAKESSEDSPVESPQRPTKRSRPPPLPANSLGMLPRRATDPVKKSNGSSETFGGTTTSSPPSNPGSGSKSGSGSRSAGSLNSPYGARQPRLLTPDHSPQPTVRSGRSVRREPSPVDYEVAENLLHAGRSLSRKGSTSEQDSPSGASVYLTGVSGRSRTPSPGLRGQTSAESLRIRHRPSALRLFGKSSSFDPVGEDDEPTAKLEASSPEPRSLSSPEMREIKRTQSMPSLIGGSSTDSEDEADFEDAREGLTDDEAGMPPLKMLRVKLATDAALLYSARSSPGHSTDRSRKESAARSITWLLSPSPEMSPTALYFPFSTVHSSTDTDADDTASLSDLQVEDQYVEMPVPPEPLRTKSLYSPTASANFLAAPPSRLRRRRLREAQRRRRTLSEGAKPRSRGPLGAYRHPGLDQGGPVIAPPAQPASPRMSTSFSWLISRSSDSRHRRSASHSRSKSASNSNSRSTQQRSTFLTGSQRGPVLRGPPLLERGARSIWSLSTVHGIDEASQVETIDSASTALPEDWLSKSIYALRCVPPTAWLFVAGFLLPPLWWAGSYFPIENRHGQKEYWGAAQSSPMLDMATDPRLPVSPQERISFMDERRSFRATHLRAIPPANVSAERMPLPSPVPQFFSETPASGMKEEDATFWAMQRSNWRWRLRNRIMSVLSFIVLIPLLVIGVLSGTKTI